MSTFLALLACASAPAEQPTRPDRVVAVGDLHGDLDNALGVLRLAGLVDADARWVGGRAVLVQTGDTTDRGPDSKEILDLLRRLEPEAAAAGGQVVALLGNHEAMNMLGDWRYVDPGDVDHFGGEEARREAFSPAGAYGAWLRTRGLAAKVGDTVFVHGGITPAWAAKGIDGINAEARAAFAGEDGSILGSDGPLWYRGFVQDPEAAACPALASSLAQLGARRMVVGHTTRKDGRIEVRCDGRLYVIDIGIADGYGAHLGALELSHGDARALYPDRTMDLPDPPDGTSPTSPTAPGGNW